MRKKRKRDAINNPENKIPAQPSKSMVNRDPNLRELPNSVKALVEEESEEYVVKGDGSCLLRTAASHVLGDEDQGPQMARDLNSHLSNYRPVYEEK